MSLRARVYGAVMGREEWVNPGEGQGANPPEFSRQALNVFGYLIQHRLISGRDNVSDHL